MNRIVSNMTLDASGSGYSITEYTSNNTVVGHIGVDSRLIYVVTRSLSSYDFICSIVMEHGLINVNTLIGSLHERFATAVFSRNPFHRVKVLKCISKYPF